MHQTAYLCAPFSSRYSCRVNISLDQQKEKKKAFQRTHVLLFDDDRCACKFTDKTSKTFFFFFSKRWAGILVLIFAVLLAKS